VLYLTSAQHFRVKEEEVQEMSAAQYTYEAMWSEEDRAFIARVREFPSLEAHGDSRGSSIRALRSVIAIVVKDLVESGEEIPPQASVKKHS
jgi:predicted RNase H-like HicB family nuclease